MSRPNAARTSIGGGGVDSGIDTILEASNMCAEHLKALAEQVKSIPSGDHSAEFVQSTKQAILEAGREIDVINTTCESSRNVLRQFQAEAALGSQSNSVSRLPEDGQAAATRLKASLEAAKT